MHAGQDPQRALPLPALLTRADERVARHHVRLEGPGTVRVRDCAFGWELSFCPWGCLNARTNDTSDISDPKYRPHCEEGRARARLARISLRSCEAPSHSPDLSHALTRELHATTLGSMPRSSMDAKTSSAFRVSACGWFSRERERKREREREREGEREGEGGRGTVHHESVASRQILGV